MFTGHWYFQNKYGALPDVEIEQDDNFEEMWEIMGAEIKSAFLTMLHHACMRLQNTLWLLAIQQKL